MKLNELKKVIDKAVESAGGHDVNVEVWFKKSAYEIMSVGQFGIIKDVTITIGKKIYDGKE